MPMVELDQIKKFNEIQKKTLDNEPTSIKCLMRMIGLVLRQNILM
jgi:hypothetical protein